MIEAVDLGVIMTLLGKIGWDEKTRRKNGNGKNGHASLEKKLDAIRSDIKEARDWAADQHGDLHARITDNAKAISRIEGRLDK